MNKIHAVKVARKKAIATKVNHVVYHNPIYGYYVAPQGGYKTRFDRVIAFWAYCPGVPLREGSTTPESERHANQAAARHVCTGADSVPWIPGWEPWVALTIAECDVAERCEADGIVYTRLSTT